MDALRFEQAALLFQQCFPTCKLGLDSLDGLFEARPRHHEMALRIYGKPIEHMPFIAGQGVERAQFIHFVAPQLDSKTDTLVRRMNFNCVATNPKRSASEIQIVALVKNLDELRQDLAARNMLAFFKHEQHAVIRFRRSQAVDTRHGCNDHNIPPLK